MRKWPPVGGGDSLRWSVSSQDQDSQSTAAVNEPPPPPQAAASSSSVNEDEPDNDAEQEKKTWGLQDTLNVWRYFILIAHVATLAVVVWIWIRNMKGKWSGVHRRWGVTNMQVAEHSTTRYTQPEMVFGNESSITEDGGIQTVGFRFEEGGGGFLWPRRVSYELVEEYISCIGHTGSVSNTKPSEEPGFDSVAASLERMGVYNEHRDADLMRCRHLMPSLVYDYASGQNSGAFTGNIDIPVLTILSLWMSISYCIFALPNTCDRQYEVQKTVRGIGARQSVWGDTKSLTIQQTAFLAYCGVQEMWVYNWVAVVVMAWNISGFILVIVGRVFIDMTPETIVICTGSMVWTLGIHLFWATVSKRTGTLLRAQVESILNDTGGESIHGGIQYWSQFMRLNEAAFSAPMLMVCAMGCMKDQHQTSTVQYIFGFVAGGLSLLIPLDAFAVMKQEQVAYNVMLCQSSLLLGDIQGARLTQYSSEVIKNGRSISFRVMTGSICMILWGCVMYICSVWPWLAVPGYHVSRDIRMVLIAAAAYPCVALALDATRDALREWGSRDNVTGKRSQPGIFLTCQNRISLIHGIVWDILCVAFKAYICVTLSMVGLDHFHH